MEKKQKDQERSELKKTFIGPVEEVKPLESHEMGIKAGVKGMEIKQVVDRVLHKLFYRSFPKVTLKAIGRYIFILKKGNACSKLLSIADILRRKVKDLSQVHFNYSRKYIAKFESEDVRNF
jgi:hypothetical protein